MNKTKELVKLVNSGSHKIDGYTVYRKISSGEWVRSSVWRKDVVLRASVELMKFC